MYTYLDSVLATTGIDGHKEILPVEILQQFCDNFPNGMPLQQQHDLSERSLGYAKNLRVITNENGHALLADIYTDKEIDFDKFDGLSIGALALFHKPKNYEIACYLPYPNYNDSEFVNELKNEDGLAIGGHIKKELSVSAIGLIATSIVLLIAPEWEVQYKTRVRPIIINAIDLIKRKLWPKGICVDLVQTVIVDGIEVKLNFIPDRKNTTSGLDPDKIDDGVFRAIRHLHSDHRSVNRLTLVYYPNRGKYEITNITFANGRDENIVP